MSKNELFGLEKRNKQVDMTNNGLDKKTELKIQNIVGNHVLAHYVLNILQFIQV